MPYQNISADLSAADVQTIKDALETVREKMPFLITLTKLERRRLFKQGGKRLSFVENALAAARNNTTILPASFDRPGFERDVNLATALNEINTIIAQLASQTGDTLMAVNAEALNSSSQVYGYVKQAAKRIPGLKPVAEQLAAQFRHNGPRTKPVPAPAA